jgi:hypothetical protein
MDFSVDRISRFSLLLIALALAWIALRPHLAPIPAEGAREAVSINIERVGGRLLTTGTIPIRCGN